MFALFLAECERRILSVKVQDKADVSLASWILHKETGSLPGLLW